MADFTLLEVSLRPRHCFIHISWFPDTKDFLFRNNWATKMGRKNKMFIFLTVHGVGRFGQFRILIILYIQFNVTTIVRTVYCLLWHFRTLILPFLGQPILHELGPKMLLSFLGEYLFHAAIYRFFLLFQCWVGLTRLMKLFAFAKIRKLYKKYAIAM